MRKTRMSMEEGTHRWARGRSSAQTAPAWRSWPGSAVHNKEADKTSGAGSKRQKRRGQTATSQQGIAADAAGNNHNGTDDEEANHKRGPRVDSRTQQKPQNQRIKRTEKSFQITSGL